MRIPINPPTMGKAIPAALTLLSWMPGASTSGESWGRSGFWGEKSGVVGRKPGFKGGKPGFEGGKCGLPPWGGFLPMVGKSGCPGGGHCPGGGAVEAQKGRSLGFRRGNEGITPRSEKKNDPK